MSLMVPCARREYRSADGPWIEEKSNAEETKRRR
jgi:hypothetical protein